MIFTYIQYYAKIGCDFWYVDTCTMNFQEKFKIFPVFIIAKLKASKYKHQMSFFFTLIVFFGTFS